MPTSFIENKRIQNLNDFSICNLWWSLFFTKYSQRSAFWEHSRDILPSFSVIKATLLVLADELQVGVRNVALRLEPLEDRRPSNLALEAPWQPAILQMVATQSACVREWGWCEAKAAVACDWWLKPGVSKLFLKKGQRVSILGLWAIWSLSHTLKPTV